MHSSNPQFLSFSIFNYLEPKENKMYILFLKTHFLYRLFENE